MTLRGSAVDVDMSTERGSTMSVDEATVRGSAMSVDEATVRGSAMSVDEATVRGSLEDHMDLVTEPTARRVPPLRSSQSRVRVWLRDTMDVSMESIASASSDVSMRTQASTSSLMSIVTSARTRSSLRSDSVLSVRTASVASDHTGGSSSTLRPPRRMEVFVEVPMRPPRLRSRAGSLASTEPAVE